MFLDFKNLSLVRQIIFLGIGFLILVLVNFLVVDHYREELKDNMRLINATRKLDNLSVQIPLLTDAYVRGNTDIANILEKSSEEFEKNVMLLVSKTDQLVVANDSALINVDGVYNATPKGIADAWRAMKPFVENVLFEPLQRDTVVQEQKEIPLYDSLNTITTETTQKVLKISNNNLQKANNYVQAHAWELNNLVGNLLKQQLEGNKQKHDAFSHMLFLYLIIFIGAIIFAIVFIYKRFLEPLSNIEDATNRIKNGDLSDVNYHIYNNEYGKVLYTLAGIKDNLKNATSFINKIEQGKLHENFHGIDEEQISKDSLEGALLTMREEMQKVQQQEKERNWSTEGLAKFVDILRANDSNVRELGDIIISNLVKYTKSNQGAIYIVDDEDSSELKLELISLFAFDTKKFERRTYRPGESLVGQVFQEKETIYLLEVPQDYIKITSGLGESNPKAILLVPLMVNNEIYGIIELASFNEYQQFEIEFVEKLGESIASTIAGVKNNERTKYLLEESQGLTQQMQAQDEEMRQNMEELQATQEQLQRQMNENNDMHQNLLKEKALLDALMNYLPDYIYFKDIDSKFIRISKSMEKLFPLSMEEMVGKSDFDFQSYEVAQEYFNEEKKIIASNSGYVNKLVHEKMNNGYDQWAITTKLPFYDESGKCIGTFGITKDVTEVKDELGVKEAVSSLENVDEAEEFLRQHLEELQITQEQLDEKLQKAETSLDAIDKVVKLISLDKSGIVSNVNFAAQVELGVKKNEIIEQDIATLTDVNVLTDIDWGKVNQKTINLTIHGENTEISANIYADKGRAFVHIMWI